jgi:chromosome segregation ATPase
MKSPIIFVLVLAASMASSPFAQGVYLCSQPNGTREYRNTGDTRGCRKLELEAISTIPSTSTSSSQAKLDASGAAFPKIESQVQKRRDQDRMQILLDEVRTEEGKLAELKKEFQNGEPERQGGERNYAKYQDRVAMMKEEMQRTEKNIEALRREISQLK